MGKNRITTLGTGTSTGVPMPTCNCRVCLSSIKENKRLRTSLFLQLSSGKNILIDASPDLRTQVLTHNIQKIDAAIITHDHADHLHGIDDLRPFAFSLQNSGQGLPIYVSDYHAPVIENRFDYIFKRHQVFTAARPYLGGGLPQLDLKQIKMEIGKIQSFTIENEVFDFFLLPHGHSQSMAFHHQGFAYVIDCHEVPLPILNWLGSLNLKLMIIDCLQEDPHPSHLTRKKCFHAINHIRPKQAFLIHMNHQLEHFELAALAAQECSVPTAVCADGITIEY
jgi:phosphoribosyl 1,2-cyclic phosphate phosphodiesterase